MRVTIILVVIGALGTVPQRLGKGVRRAGNWGTNWDDLNYSIVKIGKNCETSPGDLRRLAGTCSKERPSANMVGGTCKEYLTYTQEYI